MPRGTAVFGLLVARDGVWLGSDTDYIGINPAYKRQKLAFFPYEGGYTATATTTPTLPATVYVGRGTAGATTSVSSWGFDGTTAGTETTSGSAIDWSTIRGAFTVGDKLYLGTTGTLQVAGFNGQSIGTVSAVNPYHDPKWMTWPNGSGGTYDGANPSFYSAAVLGDGDVLRPGQAVLRQRRLVTAVAAVLGGQWDRRSRRDGGLVVHELRGRRRHVRRRLQAVLRQAQHG